MDPYRILGVNESATDEEVTAAYRRLARKYHPDLNGGSPEAEERMKEVNTAYDAIRAHRAGKGTGEAQGSPYGNPYGNPYGTGNPYGYGYGEGQGEGGPYYTGYGPFGPFRVYRTSYRRPRLGFSFLRFFLTLLLLSALLRGCSALSYYYTEILPSYFSYESSTAPTSTATPPVTKGPMI